MVDEPVMLDPRLWAIIAVSALALYLLDGTCRWLIDRNSRWSGAYKRAARVLMFFVFFVLISTIALYYATAVVF
jgi:hypothetical protein